MLKHFIFLILLSCSSFFIVDAFSQIEIEVSKESERISGISGWLDVEKVNFQEQLQIVIDETGLKNKISFLFVSTDEIDIQLPEELRSITLDPTVKAIIFTNEFNCLEDREKACIIVTVETEITDDVISMKENIRVVSDAVVEQGLFGFHKEVHDPITDQIEGTIKFNSLSFTAPTSAPVDPDTETEETKKILGKVTYELKHNDTFKLLNSFGPILLNENIWRGGGFYNNAEELSKENFSEFSIAYLLDEQETLRILKISLTCSNQLQKYPPCLSDKIDEQIRNGEISPLEFIQAENINRSGLFADGFLPLNSVIQVIIISDDNLQVKSVNSNVLTGLDSLGDVQTNGWFFTSKSGNKIDARYIFGPETAFSKNDLVLSIGQYSDDTTEVKEGGGGGCLIATAAFGSELAPQIQQLRELRDNTVLQTESGSVFMASFNQFYYSFSPAIADYERQDTIFREVVKLSLTPLLTSLLLLQYTDINSEFEMLGYGISVILLNIGMYFVAPAVLIIKVKKLVS